MDNTINRIYNDIKIQPFQVPGNYTLIMMDTGRENVLG